MCRLFVMGCLLLSWALAKTPYHIAVCGASRAAEELDMALELSAGVLVKKCQDKKLDAFIQVSAKDVHAYSGSNLILSHKRRAEQLTEQQAEQFIRALLKKLSTKPEKIVLLPPPPKVPDAGVQSETISLESPSENTVQDLADAELQEDAEKKWQVETRVSVDQWDYQISTKPYPGVQLGMRYEFLEAWILDGKVAFGTSAFQVGDHVIWNQQLFVLMGMGRKFNWGEHGGLLPRVGYLYWGSFADASELPQFGRSDIELGLELIYQFPNTGFEIGALVSFLPVNLGVQNQIFARYYFIPDWFVCLQGNWLSFWAEDVPTTFLSASLGLGVLL